jgi:hypothetical protein
MRTTSDRSTRAAGPVAGGTMGGRTMTISRRRVLEAMAASVGAVAVMAAAPTLAAATTEEQRHDLDLFYSWLHSPITAAVLILVWLAIVVLAFTPFGERLTHHRASDTLRAVIVTVGVLGVLSWVTQSMWFRILMFVALWGVACWYIVTLIGPAVTGASLAAGRLTPEQRREREAEVAAGRVRGAALEQVLGEMEYEEHPGSMPVDRG